MSILRSLRESKIRKEADAARESINQKIAAARGETPRGVRPARVIGDAISGADAPLEPGERAAAEIRVESATATDGATALRRRLRREANSFMPIKKPTVPTP